MKRAYYQNKVSSFLKDDQEKILGELARHHHFELDMVIFVPQGDERDPTRPPIFYDGAYNFLKLCGIEDLR